MEIGNMSRRRHHFLRDKIRREMINTHFNDLNDYLWTFYQAIYFHEKSKSVEIPSTLKAVMVESIIDDAMLKSLESMRISSGIYVSQFGGILPRW